MINKREYQSKAVELEQQYNEGECSERLFEELLALYWELLKEVD